MTKEEGIQVIRPFLRFVGDDELLKAFDAVIGPLEGELEGEWIPHYRTTMEGNPNYHDGWECSRCGGLQYNRFPFCPACGSKNRRGR